MIKELKERKAQEKSGKPENSENKENAENHGLDSTLNTSTLSGFNMSSSVTIPGLDLIDGEGSPHPSDNATNGDKTSVLNGDINHRTELSVTSVQNKVADSDSSEIVNGVTNSTASANKVSNDQNVRRIEEEMDFRDNGLGGVRENTLQKVDTLDDLNPHNFSPKLALVDESDTAESADVTADSMDDRYILAYILGTLQAEVHSVEFCDISVVYYIWKALIILYYFLINIMRVLFYHEMHNTP